MQVLLLTDFSTNAKLVQDYALNFFSDNEVHFILMHAMKPCNNNKCKGSCRLDKELNLKKDYDNLEKKLKPNHKLTKIFIKNNLVDAVRNYILKSQVDIIVMGGKGKTTDNNRPFGKNAFDIVTKIRCPILVVFENSVVKLPGKVVFPLDYTTAVKTNYFKTIKKLNFWKNIDLSILEVSNKMFNRLLIQKINKKSMFDTFKDIDYHFTSLDAKDSKAFNDNCRSADMIMFMAKNLSISNQIFKGLNHHDLNPDTPLLVLHA